MNDARNARSRPIVTFRPTADNRKRRNGLRSLGEPAPPYLMLARYYSSSLGRFMAVDPSRGSTSQENPQTWNRYSYVFNNPVLALDPDGQCPSMDPDAGKVAPTLGEKIVNLIAGTAAGILNDAKIATTGKHLSGERATPVEFAIAVVSTVALFAVGPEGEAGAAESKLASVESKLGSVSAETRAISMDEAVARAADHVGGGGTMEVSGSKNFQFRSTSTDAAGNTVQKIGRMDVNPASRHVQAEGPHLNLETQVNGVSNPATDPHTPINPSTVRPGDHP